MNKKCVFPRKKMATDKGTHVPQLAILQQYTRELTEEEQCIFSNAAHALNISFDAACKMYNDAVGSISRTLDREELEAMGPYTIDPETNQLQFMQKEPFDPFHDDLD